MFKNEVKAVSQQSYLHRNQKLNLKNVHFIIVNYWCVCVWGGLCWGEGLNLLLPLSVEARGIR